MSPQAALQESRDFPRWFVLNYVSHVPKRRPAFECVQKFNIREGADLELFMPTFITYVERSGKMERVDKPLVFHYAFVKGTFAQVKKLCAEPNFFSFVLNKGAEERYAVVDEDTMNNFKRVAIAYANNVPFYPLDGVDLQDFDLVEVVEGDFPGLRGYYQPKKGGNSGKIIVRITQNLGTVTYEIKAKYLKVIEFSKNFRRAGDIIDAFVPKLYSAMRAFFAGNPLGENEISHLSSFTRRMGECSLPNPVLRVRLAAVLAMSYLILGNEGMQIKAEQTLERLSEGIKSDSLKAFVLLMLGLLRKDTDLLVKGADLANSLPGNPSQPVKALREEFTHHLKECVVDS